MPLKEYDLPEIGTVIVAKRRGARNIRLSINARGQVRVSIPSWVPYSAGLKFAKDRQAWIIEKRPRSHQNQLKNGDRIGKSHRLVFIETGSQRISTSLRPRQAIVRFSGSPDDAKVQAAAQKIAEKALRAEAEQLLPLRTSDLAAKFGLHYKSLKIKRLTSRWGSCSNAKDISLSYFLMQLPWQLIDYVILHELTHTKHLNHSPDFWAYLQKIAPNASAHRKWIREHRPIIKPTE